MSNESEYYCEKCDVRCRYKSDYDRHITTAKHKKGNFSDVCSDISTSDYYCEYCDYFCSKQSLWRKHIATQKHQKKFPFSTRKVSTPETSYECKFCAKPYDNYKSLWSHQNICSQKSRESTSTELTVVNQNNADYVGIINKLLSENNELRAFVMEQSKDTREMLDKVMEMSRSQQTINNTNTTNKFSINVFLNEQCGKAINLSEFINNIKISHQDLENNGELGFVNGISKIFMDNLKQLTLYERPIHCTDVKRETMYIRDEDSWQVDEDGKKMNSAIQDLSRKSMLSLRDWKIVNPDYQDGDSEFSYKCIVIHKGSQAGCDRTLYSKIIKNVAKETSVNKSVVARLSSV